MSIFGELDHRLSVVKRWGILHTIQQQSVAEHVFNVERIAVRIAKRWFNDHSLTIINEIMKWAHHHDDHESLMGDPPTMMKPYIMEDVFEQDHADLIKPRKPFNDHVKNVVKLADMLEAYRFLCIERALGNQYVEEHRADYRTRIQVFIMEMWPNHPTVYDDAASLMDAWHREKSGRFSKGGR